jgi:hypothetical protein
MTRIPHGVQPVLEECARESLAMEGVDTRTGFSAVNSVTRWYVDQFFCQSKSYLHEAAGWGGSTPIMAFSECMQDSDRTEFMETFQKIASNPVGRMLLWRLLIEIYRNGGAYERGISQELNRAPIINACRQLVITKDVTGDPLFSLKDNAISFGRINQGDIVGYFPIACSPQDEFVPVIYTNLCHLHIVLFHELLHLFHCLRDNDRYIEEKNEKMNIDLFGNKIEWTCVQAVPPSSGSLNPLWATLAAQQSVRTPTLQPVQSTTLLPVKLPKRTRIFQYWAQFEHECKKYRKQFCDFALLVTKDDVILQTGEGDLRQILWEYATPVLHLAWVWLDRSRMLNFEEIRTILGDFPGFRFDSGTRFCNGYELSENAFRASIGEPIRLGYGKIRRRFAPCPLQFYENKVVFDNAVESATSVLRGCGIKKDLVLADTPTSHSEITIQEEKNRLYEYE